jgi:pimeloyl-ACP methyl ester carboxylesterase
MTQMPYPENWPDIDTTMYHRSVKLFSAVKNLLSVKFELHADTQIVQGDIFLFNHFSRFETFIPQFLIFEKTCTFSSAIASGEFFYDLRRLIQHLETQLPDIETPTLLLYAGQDPIVSPQSAKSVFEKLGTTHKHLHTITAARHGILMENLGGTWAVIDEFLMRYRQQPAAPITMPQALST